ncbi:MULTISPECIES: 4Fe-4S single cluster domain-containing protein [unclassified Streptomyces]|uniref:4Fe-4S single cluster domain-containing protein n=1 Tax=unclassified Streptomyces TaxID=2593676 RepID=UPI00381E245E
MAGNTTGDRGDRTDGDAAREVRVADGWFPVETLGPGRRLVLWFQGCGLACAGCMSRHTWDAEGGRTTTVGALLRLWEAALERGAEGLTVSGGEPLAQPEALGALLRGAGVVRRRARGAQGAREAGLVGGDGGLGGLGGFGGADLLVYTGYEAHEVPSSVWAALSGADAVVTGRFRVGEPTDLVWRGSANQRIVPRTRLGVRRYGPHLRRVYPEGARVSVRGPLRGGGVRWYGVPARGEMRGMEIGAAAVGVRLGGLSWRG